MLNSSLTSARRPAVLVFWGLLVAVLLWSYWSPMTTLVQRWSSDQDYPHGFLVLPFAALLLWRRRDLLAGSTWKGSPWGLVLLGLCAAIRWASSYFYFASLDPLSLVPCLAGVVLFLGGWGALRWAWPSLVFLVFMVPLPGLLAESFSGPLQRVATSMSTYVIQTVGIPCVARGNVIVLADTEIGVAEACSGLRMMMLFLAVCTGAAFFLRMSWLKGTIVVLSAAPIAIVANVARITATAVLEAVAGHNVAAWVFHDVAGWLMMPLAVVLLWALLAFLNRLLLPSLPGGPVLLGARGAGGDRRRRA